MKLYASNKFGTAISVVAFTFLILGMFLIEINVISIEQMFLGDTLALIVYSLLYGSLGMTKADKVDENDFGAMLWSISTVFLVAFGGVYGLWLIPLNGLGLLIGGMAGIIVSAFLFYIEAWLSVYFKS